jgi:chromosome segregation ATPase
MGSLTSKEGAAAPPTNDALLKAQKSLSDCVQRSITCAENLAKATNPADIARLQAELNSVRSELADLSQRSATCATNLGQAGADLATARADLLKAPNVAEITRLQAELASARADLVKAANPGEIARLQTELATVHTELTDLRQQSAVCATNLGKSGAQLTSIRAEIASLTLRSTSCLDNLSRTAADLLSQRQRLLTFERGAMMVGIFMASPRLTLTINNLVLCANGGFREPGLYVRARGWSV